MLSTQQKEDKRELSERQTNRLWRLLEKELLNQKELLLDKLVQPGQEQVEFLRGRLAQVRMVLLAPEDILHQLKEVERRKAPNG